MTRHSFLGTSADWATNLGADETSINAQPGKRALFIPGGTVTLWDQRTGGSQYTDLRDSLNAPITEVVADDSGEFPPIQGPDATPNVWFMWADGNGGAGPRRLVVATDIGPQIDAVDAAKVAKAGDTMTGTLVLSGSTPLQVTTTTPGAGKVLVSDASGNVSWGTAGASGITTPLSLSSAQASSSILTVQNTTSGPSTSALHVISQTSGDRALGVRVTGDTTRRWGANSDGKLDWGPGNAVTDTNLYRLSSGVLKTDSALTVVGTLTASGGATLSGTVTVSTAATIPEVDGSTSSGGTLTLKSTTNATKGKILFGTSAYDEVNNRLGVATASPTVPLDVTGAAAVSGNVTVGGNLSVTGVGQRQYVVKGSDQNRTNTTLTDDSALTLPVVANATYLVQLRISAVNPVGNADIKTAWTAPSGTTGSRMCVGPTSVASAFTNRAQTQSRYALDAFSSGSAISYQLDASNGTVLIEEGILTTGGSSGSVTLQWAQNATDASNATTVQTGSYMILTRLA